MDPLVMNDRETSVLLNGGDYWCEKVRETRRGGRCRREGNGGKKGDVLDRIEDKVAISRTALSFLLVAIAVLCVVTYNTASMIVTSRAKLNSSGFISPLSEPVGVDGNSGKHVESLVEMPDDLIKGSEQGPKKKRLFHVVVSSDESIYNKWQCLIMYYYYKKFKDHPASEMGGFTRLLHSGRPDDVMDKIPTFIVDPLPPGEDRGYVVLNRPWAFVQWLEKAAIEEEYVMMAEPDHIFLRPLPNLATDDLPAAFPFFYIEPEQYENILRKFFPVEKGPITNIDPIGNSPVIIRKSVLRKIAPTWHNTSVAMKDDPEADDKFGWVLEMYGYATASALHGVKHVLRKDFMVQPPWDLYLEGIYINHYTYGSSYTKGELTYGKVGDWMFDKRSFTDKFLPRNVSLPPPGIPETVVGLIKSLNEATENIPNWPLQELHDSQ
ncbi:unnamed protein product [Calypogeia fissa]